MKAEQVYTPGELNAYDEYWDAVSTEKTLLSGRYREGLAEGEAKGEAKGLVKGEFKKAEAIARKLLAKKVPLEEIAELTELSSAEITVLMESSDLSDS